MVLELLLVICSSAAQPVSDNTYTRNANDEKDTGKEEDKEKEHESLKWITL